MKTIRQLTTSLSEVLTIKNYIQMHVISNTYVELSLHIYDRVTCVKGLLCLRSHTVSSRQLFITPLQEM